MKTPDQRQNEFCPEKTEQTEKQKQSLCHILRVLEEAEKNFTSLYMEAKTAISIGDIKTYRQKLIERAESIVRLPNKLDTEDLAVIDPELKAEIEYRVQIFTEEAQKLLKHKDAKVLYALESLLYHKSDGDKNDLKELIDDLNCIFIARV